MLKCEIETLKNMTEKELHEHFGNYIALSIALFAIIALYNVMSAVTLSLMARLFILILAFIIAIVIWTFNLLLARLHCKKRLISG